MGRLQIGQLGRPPFMSSLARSTKAAACARVIRKRAIAGGGPLSSPASSPLPSPSLPSSSRPSSSLPSSSLPSSPPSSKSSPPPPTTPSLSSPHPTPTYHT